MNTASENFETVPTNSEWWLWRLCYGAEKADCVKSEKKDLLKMVRSGGIDPSEVASAARHLSETESKLALTELELRDLVGTEATVTYGSNEEVICFSGIVKRIDLKKRQMTLRSGVEDQSVVFATGEWPTPAIVFETAVVYKH